MNTRRLVRTVAFAVAITAVPFTVEGQKVERPLDINVVAVLEVESSLTSDTTEKIPPQRAQYDSPNRGFLGTSGKKFASGHNYELWRIEVWPPGRTVYVTLRSTQFDTALAVFNPQNTSINLQNDDFEQGSTDSRIILRSTRGEFYIVVSSYEPGKSGVYTLLVQAMAP